jgi:hypothetical protein
LAEKPTDGEECVREGFTFVMAECPSTEQRGSGDLRIGFILKLRLYSGIRQEVSLFANNIMRYPSAIPQAMGELKDKF